MPYQVLKNGEIQIAVGLRLYQMFCPICGSEIYSEDEGFSKLGCSKCNKVLAYRLQPELEKAIIERAMLNGSVQ